MVAVSYRYSHLSIDRFDKFGVNFDESMAFGIACTIDGSIAALIIRFSRLV